MELDLEGTVVLVTGAGRGIGRAIAESSLRERASVVLVDAGVLDAASFAAVVPSIGSAASEAAVGQLTRTLAGELGPRGTTANAHAPGPIPSGLNGSLTKDQATRLPRRAYELAGRR